VELVVVAVVVDFLAAVAAVEMILDLKKRLVAVVPPSRRIPHSL
jgi:hypothetical protein